MYHGLPGWLWKAYGRTIPYGAAPIGPGVGSANFSWYNKDLIRGLKLLHMVYKNKEHLSYFLMIKYSNPLQMSIIYFI
ncbi:unnamed protein product [Cuscuta epithymum]|uniref:Uncharacterized protein n=1 Tax=Cuscuta epithymum TaxID=186058 RepID=A0AAV0ESN1_9ASTE|nr:unnamed protein product [Cuscuta epithymum]